MKNIKRLNIFIIFIIVLIFISIIGFTNIKLKDKIVEMQLNSINRTLIDNKNIIDNNIENKYILLKGIASLSEIQAMNWNEAYSVLLSKADEYDFEHLFIMNKDGICYYAESNTIRDQSEEEFFQQVSGNKRNITEPFVIGYEKYSTVTLSVPIFDGNRKFVGNLCGVINLKNISEEIQELNAEENVDYFILNQYGNFVVYDDMNVVYNKININNITYKDYNYLESYTALLNENRMYNTGVQKIKINNEYEYVVSTTFENAPWLLSATINIKGILNIFHDIYIVEVIIIIIGILIISVLVQRYIRAFSNDLYEIKESFYEISNKN